jgi:hypothetical protein
LTRFIDNLSEFYTNRVYDIFWTAGVVIISALIIGVIVYLAGVAEAAAAIPGALGTAGA